MKRVLSVLLCVLFPVMAFAHGGVDAVRSEQASMLVTGLIAVNPDGSVYGYSLDQRNKLPTEVINLINVTLPGWKFAPVKVDGKPVLAKALMSLRVIAYQAKPEHYVATIGGAIFGDDTPQAKNSPDCAQNACLNYATQVPPVYPVEALRNGVSGTAYVVVKVNRQGRVAQAAVWRVDLRTLADETQLDRWRRELGQSALQAARNFTFNIPNTGEVADQKQWFVYIPFNYVLGGKGWPTVGNPGYGQWDAYVPGPIQPIPWAEDDATRTASNNSADAVPDNGKPFVADTRFVLLTPIGNAASNPRAMGGATKG